MDNLEQNTGSVETTETETEEKQGRFYTEEEIQMLEQKAGDKRISQYQKTMERKQKESEKLRNMSAEDKREYELQQRENAIAEKEIEIARAANTAEGLAILADKKLDSKLIELVLHDDAEVMYSRIKLLEKAFKASVKLEVESRLGSKEPKISFSNNINHSDFTKMDYAKRLALKKSDPELYKSLQQER